MDEVVVEEVAEGLAAGDQVSQTISVGAVEVFGVIIVVRRSGL